MLPPLYMSCATFIPLCIFHLSSQYFTHTHTHKKRPFSIKFYSLYVTMFNSNKFVYYQIVLALSIIFSCFLGFSQGQLMFGFYSNSCPNAESIVSRVVSEKVKESPNNIPILLRLHFHDCYVQVLDFSNLSIYIYLILLF